MSDVNAGSTALEAAGMACTPGFQARLPQTSAISLGGTTLEPLTRYVPDAAVTMLARAQGMSQCRFHMPGLGREERKLSLR